MKVVVSKPDIFQLDSGYGAKNILYLFDVFRARTVFSVCAHDRRNLHARLRSLLADECQDRGCKHEYACYNRQQHVEIDRACHIRDVLRVVNPEPANQRASNQQQGNNGQDNVQCSHQIFLLFIA
jgi:hypothetical protein